MVSKNEVNDTNIELGPIPRSWKLTLLFEACLNITDGKHGDCENQENSGYYFISCKDIYDKKINYERARQITKMDFEETHKRTKLEANDVLLTNSGTIGRLAIARDNDLTQKTTFQKSVAVLKPDKKVIFPEFLYYSLLANKKRLIAVSGGTTQKNLLLKDIREFAILICDIDEQISISRILSDLDSKIELNQQMNKTLESIAQAIFKHWFIDFEFPDENGQPYKSSGGEMVDSELGEIPKGWMIKPIDSIAEFLNGLPLQKYAVSENEDYLPVIKIRELNNGITDSSDKASANIPKNYIVENGDVLFSWSGTLGIVIWGQGKGALNQHLFKVTSKSYPKWFYYYWVLHYLPSYVDIAKDKATTMGHIQRHHLSESLVAVPDNKTLEFMNRVFSPITDRIIQTKTESINLTKIRDLLLPKLMSGKIRVPLEE